MKTLKVGLFIGGSLIAALNGCSQLSTLEPGALSCVASIPPSALTSTASVLAAVGSSPACLVLGVDLQQAAARELLLKLPKSAP